jgi:hypothetical protein
MTPKRLKVLARRYSGGSLYCEASTPGYTYVVAIPIGVACVPDEFKEYLWTNRDHPWEEYFVFEDLLRASWLQIGDTFVSGSGWIACYLVTRTEGGLMFDMSPEVLG